MSKTDRPGRDDATGDGDGAHLATAAQRARQGLAGLFSLPAQGARTVTRASRTTPGKLLLVAVGLVSLSLLVGLVGAAMMQDKADAMTELTEHREPVTDAAQQVYRSLSDADATAASGFLSTGTEPEQLRRRYENDIAQAGAFLAKAAAGGGGERTAEQVDIIAQQLPVYTGLVETARANNRQGFPAGASYLREASELMRSKILPAAEELYRTDVERLAEQQDDAKGFPWFTTLLVLGLLGALIWAQLFLRRRTNRLFNVGLVVATAAVVVGLLWSTVALVVQAVQIGSSQSDGTEQADILAKARIAALKARADETLTLVARGGGEVYEDQFRAAFSELAGENGDGGLLADAAPSEHVDEAEDSAKAWLKAHAEVRAKDSGGEYSEAVDLAIESRREDGAPAAFGRLEGALSEGIKVGRQDFFDDTTNASRALTLLPFGWAVIGVIAALGVTVGIRERLREYQ